MTPRSTPQLGALSRPRPRDHLSDYYLLTRTFLYINKRLYREIIRPLASRLSGFLVDLGCGDAPYRPLFTGIDRYLSVDVDPGRRPMLVADACSLPILDRVADSVFCSEVIEHVPDPDGLMAEVRRVLKPGGMLLLTAPMSWNLHYAPNDFRRYTCYGLWQLLARHGFSTLETRRVGGLFSLVGSRLVDGLGTELYRRLRFLPPKVRHALVLIYTIPVSLLFLILAWVGDRFEQSDAIGWAVLARKGET